MGKDIDIIDMYAEMCITAIERDRARLYVVM